ncbi:MAG: DUF481 domain-containing protein [Candidatus Aminicenantes bacterium]
MYDVIKKIILVTAVWALLSAAAQAQEKEEKKEKAYSSSTSFSLLMTSGNTQDLTLGFETEQNLNFDKNKVQFKGSVIYSESEGTKDSELYYSHLQYKRSFSPKAYFLGHAGIERNVLSGYNYRFALNLGGGYTWWKSEKSEFSSEATLGWSRENNIQPPPLKDISLSFASVVASSKLKISLSSTSEFNIQEILFLNLDDTDDYRISSVASLAVSISSNLALKISYQLKYNHQPVPGFKSTDHYVLSSLVLNL